MGLMPANAANPFITVDQQTIFGTFKSFVVVYALNGRVGLVISAHDQLVVVPPPVGRH